MIATIIGGTGTLAKHVVPILLQNPQIRRIRLLSRGEHAQSELQEKWRNERIDFFVGDCRDRERMEKATEDCSIVFHFAAMKSVDKAEYDPWEAIQTNIEGTKNVIEACLKNQVERAIFTSTDKAVAPLNIYGASKLCAEKLFIQANIGKHRTRFAVCRYGNVLGSNGSVLNKWRTSLERMEPLQITHEEMTRFFILPENAAQFVVTSAYQMQGGEVFVPKMKSTTMINLARCFMELQGKKWQLEDAKWVGVRPGEKMHEVLISDDEVVLTTDAESHYIRWPNENLFPVMQHGKRVTKGFTSQTAERFSLQELRELICKSELGLLLKLDPRTWERSTTSKKPSKESKIPAPMPLSSSCSQTNLPM